MLPVYIPDKKRTDYMNSEINKSLLSGETSKMHSVSSHIGVLKFHACSNTG